MIEKNQGFNHNLPEQPDGSDWDELKKYYENLKKKQKNIANPVAAATMGMAALLGPVGGMVTNLALEKLPEGEVETVEYENELENLTELKIHR